MNESYLISKRRWFHIVTVMCNFNASVWPSSEIFKSLQDESGCSIGVDPFHHLTIAGVAFEGIFCKYLLPPETIGIVPRPMKSNYSVNQILWMEYEINKSGHYIHHARNEGEQQITLLTGSCLATNTVYQFHGCFYHGCPEHYESSKNTPHQVKAL